MSPLRRFGEIQSVYLISLLFASILFISAFGCKDEAADITSDTEIDRVLLQVHPGGGGMAMREFNGDGWIHGGHSSGEPERIYEERVQISMPEIEEIWGIAVALGEKFRGKVVPPDPAWEGDEELWLIYEDESYTRLSWPFGEEHPDPEVIELVNLLKKYDVGGW